MLTRDFNIMQAPHRILAIAKLLVVCSRRNRDLLETEAIPKNVSRPRLYACYILLKRL